jgi:hypothetical protein
MYDLFDATSRQAILDRLARLTPESQRQWGKMDAGQMLAHCAVALEMANGERPQKRALLGLLLSWMVRKKLLGDAPFPKNSPTNPAFVFTDPRDFGAEKARLHTAIDRFVERGPERAGEATHAFFGRLTGAEWGRLMAKHLDHHLRQFGV